MMNRNKNKIEKESDLTLKELDHLDHQEASLFFYSKLITRLNSETVERQSFFTFLFQSGFLKPALVVLFILINLISVIKFVSPTPNRDSDQMDPFDDIALSYANTTSVGSIYYLNEE